MTEIWLLVWNVSWFVFALLYMSLETRLGADSPQGDLGRNKVGLRDVEVLRKCRRPVRAPRVHRRCRR
jgi:hypothetical protein